MLNFFTKKLFGSSNDRLLKKLIPIVESTNKLEKKYEKFNDDQLLKNTLNSKRKLKTVLILMI